MMKELFFEIDKVLKELCKQYRENERIILTEGDLVSRLYSMLIEPKILDKFNLEIHNELRPYIGYNNSTFKVIKDDKWTVAKKINDGAKFDISLIDNSSVYWKDVRARISKAQTRKNTKLKYWRFLLYPCEAFRAVIEVKIRVRGNISRIRKDVNKLRLLHKKNAECLKFLLVMDREAPKRSIATIQGMLDECDFIHLYIFETCVHPT